MASLARVCVAALAIGSIAIASIASAADALGVKPKPGDKCPVCGMFVAKYPDWVAGVTFGDGTYAVFDGPKDMLKYWLEPARYRVARDRTMKRPFVTDYYTLKPIDARAAFYVAGSDILGPMGHELIPFAAEEAARDFLRDHGGKRIIRFEDVNLVFLRALDS
jgi:nitrous oxide reductase accessory protein NosL